MQLTRYLTVAGLVIFIVFLLQNISIVPVNFLFWSIELPRSMLLLVAFLLGYLVAASTRISKRRANPD